MNRPAIAGEDSGWILVLLLLRHPLPRQRYLGCCMALREDYADGQHTVAASLDDSRGAGVLGTGTCRVPAVRRGNRADRSGWTRQSKDL